MVGCVQTSGEMGECLIFGLFGAQSSSFLIEITRVVFVLKQW